MSFHVWRAACEHNAKRLLEWCKVHCPWILEQWKYVLWSSRQNDGLVLVWQMPDPSSTEFYLIGLFIFRIGLVWFGLIYASVLKKSVWGRPFSLPA